MEPVPDMDALLDEVENSADTVGPSNSSAYEWRNTTNVQTFQAPQVLNSITNSPATRFIESDPGPYIHEPEQESKEVVEEQSSEKATTPPLPEEFATQELPEMTHPETSSIDAEAPVVEENKVDENVEFDKALERYLEQFSDDDEEKTEQPQNIRSERDENELQDNSLSNMYVDKEEEFAEETSEELAHAAEMVANDILSNVMGGSDLMYTEGSIEPDQFYTIPKEPAEEEYGEDKTTSSPSKSANYQEKQKPLETWEEPEVMLAGTSKDSHKDEINREAEAQKTPEVETLSYTPELATEDEEKSSSLIVETGHQDEETEENVLEIAVVDVVDEEPSGFHQEETPVDCVEDATENTIATFHNLDQESSSSRLTESELLLGKQKPYWIPDSDCDSCMLCSSRFTLLSRRHHCRACGRVLCSTCCGSKAILEYMKTEDEAKKSLPARVCQPCVVMLAKIEEYEKQRAEREQSVAPPKGVLKSRSETEAEQNEPSTSEAPVQPKRSVTFRDGVNPGTGSGIAPDAERSTAIRPKKKSRKRPSIVRRVTELKLEDELTCYLPAEETQPLIVRTTHGSFENQTWEETAQRIHEGSLATVVVRKNLLCTVQASTVSETEIYSAVSRGFDSVGLDEVVFIWKRKDEEVGIREVLVVLDRISQIFRSALDGDSSGVQQVVSRFPRIHSSSQTAYPLPKHIYFYRPTSQQFGPLKVPSTPFLVACFLADSELSWIMACPNRVLFRLGLKYGFYPFPIVNIPEREAVFSSETMNTVLKVFTDFRSWTFRMVSIPGSTLALTNETTILKIPRDAQSEIKTIMSWNKAMLAWSCDVNSSADSHLVCEENDGIYSTHVFSKGNTRNATGASFVILDGGLKSTSQLQVSVFEDGVAIRVQAEQYRAICEALQELDPRDISVKDSSGTELFIEWVESNENVGKYAVTSPIDKLLLEDKFQYGLSLERALTAILEVQSVPGLGVRLSHVYNLHKGRLAPEEEPKVFSIVEMLSRECTALLGPYLPALISLDIESVTIRFYAFQDSVEYDVSSWLGLEQENVKYRESMDQLIPVLCNLAEYVSNGIHLEFTLTFIQTMALPTPV